MLRKISMAVLLVAVIVVPLIAYAQSSPDKSAPAHLVRVDFNSRPEFAEIRVDGVFVGTAPLPYRLTPGVHKIEMSRRGFQTWTRELYVNNDVPTGVTAILDDAERTAK